MNSSGVQFFPYVLNSPSKDPITSYGILLFYVDDENNIWYLLAQRRDTIEYTDYLRGRYSNTNLQTYFSLMTIDERERLKKYTFDELWDDLWINHNNNFFREAKTKAKNKYDYNKINMTKYLEITQSTKTEPVWGFPKGKKNTKETELQCAFREFKEETRLNIDYINLLSLSPTKEVFKGSNGKMYSTIYYIARIYTKIEIKKINTNGIRKETVSEEISNLKWTKLDEALNVLPPWRQKLLIETEAKIRKYLGSKTSGLETIIQLK